MLKFGFDFIGDRVMKGVFRIISRGKRK